MTTVGDGMDFDRLISLASMPCCQLRMHSFDSFIRHTTILSRLLSQTRPTPSFYHSNRRSIVSVAVGSARPPLSLRT